MRFAAIRFTIDFFRVDSAATRYPLTGANELDVVRRRRRVNGRVAGRENSSGKHGGFLCSVEGGKKNFLEAESEKKFSRSCFSNISSFDSRSQIRGLKILFVDNNVEKKEWII